jgi:hypothetical protein
LQELDITAVHELAGIVFSQILYFGSPCELRPPLGGIWVPSIAAAFTSDLVAAVRCADGSAFLASPVNVVYVLLALLQSTPEQVRPAHAISVTAYSASHQ